MEKLHLPDLRVDSFATTPAAPRVRGTVAARENTGTPACPISWDGTCYVTCGDTCYCDTAFPCS